MAFDESEIKIIKRAIPLILVFVIMSLVLVTIFGAWYNVHMDRSLAPETEEFNMHLTKVSLKVDSSTLPSALEMDMSYDELKDVSSEDDINTTGLNTDSLNVFGSTLYFISSALTISIFSIILMLLSAFNFGNIELFKKTVTYFCIIIFVLTIAAGALFMVQVHFSNLVDADVGFWFSSKVTNIIKASGGPGASWYMSFVTGGAALATAIMLYRKPVDDIILTKLDQETEKKIAQRDPSKYPCPDCGHHIPLDSKVCPYCGREFEEFKGLF